MVKEFSGLDGGPLAVVAAGCRSYLVAAGFSPRAVRERMDLLGQLNVWLAAQGLPAAGLTSAEAQRFFASRRAAGQRRVPTLQTLAPIFDYLRAEAVLQAEPSKTPAQDVLVAEYREYLTRCRGLAPLTVVRYERMAKRFLAHRMSDKGGQTGAEGLDAEEVHRYLLQCCSRLVIESAKREAADLRSLLRFLYLQGRTDTDLSAAMPPVAGWRDQRLPATMSAAQVTVIIDGCDRSRPRGQRDYAILNLLGRLGLRSGEVAGLQLRDIDWRAGEIWVRGKGRRETRLPLLADVGEAVAAYLHQGRPRAQCPNVILTCTAPFRGIHPSSITRIAYEACHRVGQPPVGGHRFRHALATEMLRQGNDLLEIGQVLRHRDLATTSAYAKLDHTALLMVARAWPGAQR